MTADFFAVLDIPRSFNLNLTHLEQQYFAAQRRFHPDRLIGKTAMERQQAISQSMLANEAYDTLKSSLKRAQHLLALEGIAGDSVKPSQALLMEIMELRESLAEAATLQEIEELAHRNDAAKAEALSLLSRAFSAADNHTAAETTMRLSYLMKLEDEVRIRRKAAA